MSLFRAVTLSEFNTYAKKTSSSSTSTKNQSWRIQFLNWFLIRELDWKEMCWLCRILLRNIIKLFDACMNFFNKQSRNIRIRRKKWLRLYLRISIYANGKSFNYKRSLNFLLDLFFLMHYSTYHHLSFRTKNSHRFLCFFSYNGCVIMNKKKITSPSQVPLLLFTPSQFCIYSKKN